MAKSFLVIACVCYCTMCMHLAVTVLATTRMENEHSKLDAESGNAKMSIALHNPHRHPNDGQPSINPKATLESLGESREENVPIQNDISVELQRHRQRRRKRHAVDHHDDDGIELNPNAHIFVRKLFQQFGNGEQETMNVTGFEQMLQHLGLYRMIEDFSHNETKPKLNGDSGITDATHAAAHTNETCMSSVSLLQKVSSNGENAKSDNLQNYDKLVEQIHHHHDDVHEHDQHHQSSAATADGVTSFDNRSMTIETIKSIKDSVNLNKNDLWSLCPILLYQLAAPTSLERSGCVNSELLLDNVHKNHHVHHDDRTLVWIYASLSIIIASLCGLLGVAVIPCMERRYYQYVLQFFVALAVGTLAGDALLHLLPHAMMTFSSTENGHDSMTWKGLVAALGIIFFFLTERVLTMIAEWRKKIQKRDDPPARVRVMRDPDSVSVNHSLNGGEKQCKHKYSSYPYCYDEIALETKDNHHQHHQHGTGHSHGKENGVRALSASPPKEKLCAKTLIDRANDYPDTAQRLLGATHNHHNHGPSSCTEKDEVLTPDNNTVLTNLDDGSLEACGCEHKKSPENYTIILREHESKHHGHSHTHGHVHSPPKTLSAVAWMVIMGDGLHNFTDGMAIGAAFSNSIAGGFSTAIAVFCHELPHELGDFAVLLKAGMSARKAVYYNVLSSVLSFFGMVVGIIVGDTPEASAWIFACAAGMFIYIALVDMMPELTTAHNEHSAITQCVLQFIGMIMGVTIMLLIALFENDLKVIFTSEGYDHDHHHYSSHHH